MEHGSDTSTILRIKRLLEDRTQDGSRVDTLYLADICRKLGVRGHVGVFVQPYLDLILKHQKTMESRFSKFRVAPFGRIKAGDVLFIKEKAGPLRAIAEVSKARFLGPFKPGEALKTMLDLKNELLLEYSFMQSKSRSIYSTLINFGLICPMTPIAFAKKDRRPWVILSGEKPKSGVPFQLTLFPNQDCRSGLHSYHKSKSLNSAGFPVCRFCGADVIDWLRMYHLDSGDSAYTISQLKTDKFRWEWWTREIDQIARARALRKGLTGLRKEAFSRLKKSVGDVHQMVDGTMQPYRDGYQTPFSGNIIYYAQHALACCCRKCMKIWHGVSHGRDLTNRELEYFVNLIMTYIKERIPELDRNETPAIGR